MNKGKFLENMAKKSADYSVLGMEIVKLLEGVGMAVDDLDYRSLYTFINQPANRGSKDHQKIIAWMKENITEGALVEDVYTEYLFWVDEEDVLLLSNLEFGKLVNRETKFRTVPKYVSAYGKTMRVYELKD